MVKIDVAGLKIDSLPKQELLRQILERLKSNQKTFLTTPYSEFLYHGLRDRGILTILNSADFAVPDGIGILWAAKYLQLSLTAKSHTGKIIQSFWQIVYTGAAILLRPNFIRQQTLQKKIPGSELIWDIAELAAREGLSLYLLGGFGDTPKIAANKLQLRVDNFRTYAKHQQLKIAGWSNKNPGDQSIIADIQKAKPDILLVAFGPLRQEQWIADHKDQLPARLFIGLGGTFDYLAGTKIAPPTWVRSVGLEWLYRLLTQPKRIGRIWDATVGLVSEVWHYKLLKNLP